MKVSSSMGRKMVEEKYFIRMVINSKGNGIKEKSMGLDDTLIFEMTVFSKVFGVKENIVVKKAIINSSLFNFHDINNNNFQSFIFLFLLTLFTLLSLMPDNITILIYIIS